MASSGYLVSPRKDPSKENLWTETWKRIDRFLPDLRSDLALEEPQEEVQAEEEEQKSSEEKAVDLTPIDAVEEDAGDKDSKEEEAKEAE
jgi:brefeldin A-resistance guanine nucleotide exchange factor 1